VKFAVGPLTLDVSHVTRPDKTSETKIHIAGKALDEWKVEGERKFAWGVRWARHLILRGIVGLVGFTFVASLAPGPWVATAYAVALFAAGDLAVRLDLRRPK